MRMTIGMIMDSYNGTLSDNLNALNSSFNQISSQRKFSRASDDPSAAMQTLNSLHNINDLQQYKSNIDQTTSWMNSTESNVNTINQIVQSAQETLTSANNSGTLSDSDNKTNALTLQNLQSEILQTLNETFNGRYFYGGSKSGPAPFKAGVAAADGAANDGKLMYYDYKVTSAYVPFSSINSNNVDSMKLTMPVDVGLGMKFASGKVEPGTAFESSTSSIDMMSSNMTAAGCQNIYDILGSAITKLQSGGHVDLGSELASSQQAYDSILSTTVNIGEKTKMLNFLSDRNQTQDANEQTRLSQVSDVDTTQAITNYQMRQMVYQASLSVGAKIMQPSLIDFMK
jgi:flagellar hook-associated protein 3 FlgL